MLSTLPPTRFLYWPSSLGLINLPIMLEVLGSKSVLARALGLGHPNSRGSQSVFWESNCESRVGAAWAFSVGTVEEVGTQCTLQTPGQDKAAQLSAGHGLCGASPYTGACMRAVASARLMPGTLEDTETRRSTGLG